MATDLERFLGCDEVVEGRGEEDPHEIWVAEGEMAGGAEEDEVFEGIEIGQMGDTTALEVVELEGEVSLDEVRDRGLWRRYEGEVRCSNDVCSMLPV